MSHWIENLADHLGEAYLRYSFTKGTAKEIDSLVERLGLTGRERVLDVGCGPGRHANELGRRGFDVVGVDISRTFLEIASAGAPPTVSYRRLDARRLPFVGEFDVVVSICQGAFGMSEGPDRGAALDPDLAGLDGLARAARPGGAVVFTAFNAYLQITGLLDGNHFDADRGVHRERTEIRSESGESAATDLWTTCFTPRELRLMAARAGLVVASIDSVEPGDWSPARPVLDSPEFLVITHRELRDDGTGLERGEDRG